MSRTRATRLVREAAELDQDDAGDVYPEQGARAAVERMRALATEHQDRAVIAAIAELGLDDAAALYDEARSPTGPRRPGPRPRGGEAMRKFTFRALEDELGAWSDLAGDQPLGEWIRDSCNARRR